MIEEPPPYLWNNLTPEEQGFNSLFLPFLKRKTSTQQLYNVFSDDDNFEIIEADTALSAIEKSNIEKPLKLIQSQCKISNVIDYGDLEQLSVDNNQEQSANITEPTSQTTQTDAENSTS